MKKPELKPCPLDGEPVQLFKLGNWHSIRCVKCGLKIEKHMDADTLAAVWNNRTMQNDTAPEIDQEFV